MKCVLTLQLSIILLSSCENRVKLGVFDVQSDLNYKELRNQGFEKTQVDVLMFEKSNGDTTIYIEFDDSERFYATYWEFPEPENIDMFYDRHSLIVACQSRNKSYLNSVLLRHSDNELFFVYTREGFMEIRHLQKLEEIYENE